jgi:hypothetical protein
MCYNQLDNKHNHFLILKTLYVLHVLKKYYALLHWMMCELHAMWHSGGCINTWIYRAGWCSKTARHLNLGNTQCETWFRHQLSWHVFVFTSNSPGKCQESWVQLNTTPEDCTSAETCQGSNLMIVFYSNSAFCWQLQVYYIRNAQCKPL